MKADVGNNRSSFRVATKSWVLREKKVRRESEGEREGQESVVQTGRAYDTQSLGGVYMSKKHSKGMEARSVREREENEIRVAEGWNVEALQIHCEWAVKYSKDSLFSDSSFNALGLNSVKALRRETRGIGDIGEGREEKEK